MILRRPPCNDAMLDALATLAVFGRVRFWGAGYRMCPELADERVICLDGMERPPSADTHLHLPWRIGVIASAIAPVDVVHIEHPLRDTESWVDRSTGLVCRGCIRDWVIQSRPDPRDPSVRTIIDMAAVGPATWRFDSFDLLERVDQLDRQLQAGSL